MKRIVPVLLILILLSIPAVIITPDDSDAVSDIPTVTIDSPLYFNTVTGGTSADLINEKAGKTVCSYEKGDLVFSKSCRIFLQSSAPSDMLIFNGTNDHQSLTVKEDARVYLGISTDCKDTDGKRYAFIKAENNYFDIVGRGQLIIKPANIDPAIGEYYDGISCIGILTFKYADVLITNDGDKFGYGIHEKGEKLNINSSTVTINTTVYGIYMNNGVSSTMTWDSCTLDITGGETCFNYSGKCSCEQKNVTIQIYGFGGMYTYNSASAITLYQSNNVKTIVDTHSDSINTGVIVLLGIVVFITIYLVYMGIGKYNRKKKDTKKVPPEKIIRQQGDGYTDISSHDVETVSLKVQILKEDETLEIYVDGVYYGLITDKRTFIEMTKGTHGIILRKCDDDNTVVYKGHLFISGLPSMQVSVSHGIYEVSVNSDDI